ncbi:hypothetical protein EB796_009290 [Bugula neritina]|uniref:Uncharacterized protein n=1 Tax=Bugula neritina TaxID=10212 RepID=A0A7J7K384_BUGNE|nr:hypothetical protein EB796_009290 [Bugula neritina]
MTNRDIVNKTDDLLDGIQSKVEVFLDDSSKVLTSTLLNMTHVEEPVFELANAITDFNSTLLNLVDSLQDFETIRLDTATNFSRAANAY